MEITKREILFSTIIFSLMLGLGVWLSNPILSSVHEKELRYASSVRVYTDSEFDYIRRTDAGDFLAEGRLSAIDPVSIPDIPGKYMEISKEKEKYTMHVQTYTTSDGKGHTTVHKRTYWSLDHVHTDHFVSDSVMFLGNSFGENDIKFNRNLSYHSTIKESSHIRYIYRVYPTDTLGLVIGNCKDKSYNSMEFKPGMNIEKFNENINSRTNGQTFIYWFLWFIVTGLLIFLFYYFENKWLED